MSDVQRLLIDLAKRTPRNPWLACSHQLLSGFCASVIELPSRCGLLLTGSSLPLSSISESSTSALRTQSSSQVIPCGGHEELSVR